MKYSNPIIPGFYPDPSICKFEDKYYMVHSSFQYFPGVPLFESRDLLNWKQIGHVLTRESQLPLKEATRSTGIFAPTIRVHNKRFYMVTTNVSAGGNFYVWTDDIYGEWSEPIYVDQGGIDPSLYFEGDTCYFMSNGEDANGKSAIIQCEIDVETGKKKTEGIPIWNGNGGRFLESPHLYKIGDTYHILAAEGGTEYGHMVITAKGSTPYGPFTGSPENPILTNRNLGGYEIQGCGHADMVEDDNGNFWMVHLAFRQIGVWSMFHITGRETYMVPVTFDQNGFIAAGENKTTRACVETDKLPECAHQCPRRKYTFASTARGLEWCFLRNPNPECYTFDEDSVSLLGQTANLSDTLGSPTATFIRQCEMNGSVSVAVTVQEGEAGLTIYMDEYHHYDIYAVKTDKGIVIQKRTCLGDIITVTHSVEILSAEAVKVKFTVALTQMGYIFEAVALGEHYGFGYNQTKYVSTEVAEGFTGVMFGLYAQTQGKDAPPCKKPAVFEDFTLLYSQEAK